MIRKKLMAVLLSVAMIATMAPATSKTQEVKAASAGTRVVGYFPSYRTYAINSVDFSAMTHCMLAFMTYSNGTLTSGFSGGDVQTIVNKCHASGTKAMIAIGGWNGFDSSDNPFGTAQKRTNFVNQVMNYVNTYNLDGVDIDIELTDANIWNNYNALVSELSGRLKSQGKLLTMAVSTWFTGSISNSTYRYFDFLNLMSYDYNQSGTGEVAPWSQIYDMVSYYGSRGVSNDKLVIGVPFYGYGAGGAAKTFAEMVAMNPAYADMDYAAGVYYNGMSTIRKKAEYSKSYGGTMIWEVAQDSFGTYSLLNVIKQVMKTGNNNSGNNNSGNNNSGNNNSGNNNSGNTSTPSSGMGINYVNASSATAYVNDSKWTDIHYTVNGGAQQNVRMNQDGNKAVYTINGLSSGATVKYWFTYCNTSGYVQDTQSYTYTHTGSGNSNSGNNNGSNTGSNTNTGSGDVYIYQDANYGGRSASLGVGNYNLASLQAKGFKNDDLSSIKVPWGYKVIMYADDNFSGSTKVVNGDTAYVGNDWNDKVSSIKVQRAQYKIVNRNSGLCLDVSGGSKDNGANIQQWTDNGTVAQKWEVRFNAGDSTYVLVNVGSGKAMDMDAWSKDNGGNAIQWDNNNTDNQRWFITSVDNGYTFLINKNSNKALDVEAWSTAAGGNVHQWDYGAQANQQWKFVQVN